MIFVLKNKYIIFVVPFMQNGTLTEWLGSGLQNRVRQFESARYLKTKTPTLLISIGVFYFIKLQLIKKFINFYFHDNLQTGCRPLQFLTRMQTDGNA